MKPDLDLLWNRFRRDRCQKARGLLIEHYYYLARLTAARLAPKVPPSMELPELAGAGVLGLIRAIDLFDFRPGVKFETYAIALIRGAILEFLREDDWVPRSVREGVRKLMQAKEKIEMRTREEASEEQIAGELGITLAELDALKRLYSRTHLNHLDNIACRDKTSAGDILLVDLLRTDEALPEENAFAQERHRLLDRALNRLPERERDIVLLYYCADLTFKQIGAELVPPISESRAYQLHAQAIRRLRDYLEYQREAF